MKHLRLVSLLTVWVFLAGHVFAASPSTSTLVSLITAVVTATPESVAPIPAELTQRFATLYPTLRPSAKSWVDQEGRRFARSGTIDIGAVRASVQTRFPTLGSSASAADIDEMAFVVLMAATNEMDDELQDEIKEVQAQTWAKQQLRDLIYEINKDLANAAQQSYADADPCADPGYRHYHPLLCASLRTRLANISAATMQLPRPIHLSAPAHLTYGNLAVLRKQLLQADESLTEQGTGLRARVQRIQRTRTQVLKILGDILHKISGVDSPIIANLK
jgi:hypothetical protein